MEIPQSYIRTGIRSGQKFYSISDHDLRNWAQLHDLTMRQAVGEALRTGIFPESYERNFPSLSCRDQLRLFESSVLVAGLGGLGGALALCLARAGVGHFLLADGDVFTLSNLNRQCLAIRPALGENKALTAAAHLLNINPAIRAEAIPEFLRQDNLPKYLPQVQVVMDGLDNLASRRELCRAAQKAGVPLVHGAVAGRFGQVATILPDDPDGLAKIYPETAAEPEGSRDILAPLAVLTASLQAQEALRLLLGQPPVYHGRLAHFDGDTGTLELLAL